MGLGGRIFVFDDDDNLRRVSVKKFTQLFLRPKSSEPFPEFANQRVRYAFVMIEFENKKPIEIFYVQYSIVKFDEKGKLDIDERDRADQLSFDATSSYKPKISSSSVIDAKKLFSHKRYQNEFRWQPSPEIEEAIIKAVFVEKKPKLRLV